MKQDRRTFIRTSATAALLATQSRFLPAMTGPRSGLPNEFGAVKPVSDFDEAVKAGLDYFEPPAYEIAEMTEAAFAQFRDRVLASPIRCSHVNFFIRSLRVDGPDVDMPALQRYTETTLERCRQLGCKIMIFGSAVSRTVPDGFSRDRAREQIADFVRMAEPIARSKGILFGIEPIRKSSSNILSTGAEVVQFVRELNLPNLRMNIDYYQMRSMEERSQILWEARDKIVHIHFARFDPHGWPVNPDEDPEYATFFGLLKKMHYKGGISIEAPGSIADNAAAAIKFLRQELA